MQAIKPFTLSYLPIGLINLPFPILLRVSAPTEVGWGRAKLSSGINFIKATGVGTFSCVYEGTIDFLRQRLVLQVDFADRLFVPVIFDRKKLGLALSDGMGQHS